MWLDRAIKWLLPREDHFYDLLEKGVACTVGAGEILIDCCRASTEPERAALIQKLRDAEHAADRVILEVYEALNRTFVTPLDRSDIYALATELENVVDRMNSTGSQFNVHALAELPEGAMELATFIQRATGHMEGAVKELRQLRNLKSITDQCNAIHKLESDGDRVFRERMQALYRNEKDAIRLIKHKEFLEELEYTLDVCADVANALENVVIKNA
ncbi:MAG: DUF47 family protein [Deltaproteobacteria bacterium]|nr:DUF47 family protein [Deltaproteobacteria bacterium]